MFRVKRELSLPQDEGILLRILDNWQELEATIQGPSDSPFAGGTFVLNIKLPEVFPFVGGAPKVKFSTLIWHPNVSPDDGSLCDDFLSDWAPAITIRSLCIFLQSLLFQPDLVKPINPAAARQYLDSPDAYKETVKYWTHVYASGPADDHAVHEKETKVRWLLTKTLQPVAAVRLVLSSANWDSQRAEDAMLEPPPSPALLLEATTEAPCQPVIAPVDEPRDDTVMEDLEESDYEGFDDFDVDSDSLDESVTSGSDRGSPR